MRARASGAWWCTEVYGRPAARAPDGASRNTDGGRGLGYRGERSHSRPTGHTRSRRMEPKTTTHPDRRRFCGGLAHLVPAAAVALLTGAAFALGQTPTKVPQTRAAPAGEIHRIAIVLAREL